MQDTGAQAPVTPDEDDARLESLGYRPQLSRVLGLLMFVPIPGMKSAPDAPRIVFALALTVCLRGFWPAIPGPNPTPLHLTAMVLAQMVIKNNPAR